MSFAHTTILGHLGRDPETSEAGETTVTRLAVAVTRRVQRQGEDAREFTTWWSVQVWGKRGQTVAKFLKKGDQVLCHGYPELQEYTDRDGVVRKQLRLLDADWAFASAKRDAAPARERTDDDRYAAAATAFPEQPAPATPPQAGPQPGADEPPF